MAPDPHIMALADLLIGIVLREMKAAENKEQMSDDSQKKENAREGRAHPYEITT